MAKTSAATSSNAVSFFREDAASRLLLLLFLPSLLLRTSEAQLGINYGRVANNLPSASTAVALMKSRGIDKVKIFDADSEVLKALANTNIKVTITVTNQDIARVASSGGAADAWVASNVVPYLPNTQIVTILVGNEILSDNRNDWSTLVPAMENLFSSLQSRNLASQIKVSTPLAADSLSTSFPPSAGTFRSDVAGSVMPPLLAFLDRTGSPYHANVYPYFAYSGGSTGISLEYALGGGSDVHGSLGYRNLMDAMIDATFAALERLGFGNVNVVVSETGWPSGGDGGAASISNARAYNARLARRASSSGSVSTRRRPRSVIPIYIFNENAKSGAATEQNFGILYPSGSPRRPNLISN